MSSITARTYLTPEEYIALEGKATLNGYSANSARLRTCYHSFQLRQNCPYVRFTDLLNLKPMLTFKRL